VRTAIGLFEEARERALRARLLAARAAQRGRQGRAVRLTTLAQHYDERAAEWRAVVPAWQWATGYRA